MRLYGMLFGIFGILCANNDRFKLLQVVDRIRHFLRYVIDYKFISVASLHFSVWKVWGQFMKQPKFPLSPRRNCQWLLFCPAVHGTRLSQNKNRKRAPERRRPPTDRAMCRSEAAARYDELPWRRHIRDRVISAFRSRMRTCLSCSCARDFRLWRRSVCKRRATALRCRLFSAKQQNPATCSSCCIDPLLVYS